MTLLAAAGESLEADVKPRVFLRILIQVKTMMVI